MTLHFRWLQAHAHFSRAMTLVLGVIGVSLLFSALRVLDAAISGGLVDGHVTAAAAPAASATAMPADLVIGNDPPAAGPRPVDDSAVVPEAAAEAISL